MTCAALAFIALCFAALPVTAITQTPRDMQGPSRPSDSRGTGILSGVVVTDDASPQPLRRATVTLMSGDLRVPLSAVTDDRGAFSFEAVPDGTYAIAASKAAYVGTFYGSALPGRGPGVPVAVRPGQHVTLTLKMMRGGVIAGVLRLPSGRPAPNMPMAVAGIETTGGVRRLRSTGARTSTNDRGEYRVFGLPPGDYIVQAQPSGFLTGAPGGPQFAPLVTAGVVSWAEQAAAAFRSGRASNVPPPPQADRPAHYAVVYFPGDPNPAHAAAITVTPGIERNDVNFSLAFEQTAVIAGTVSLADGNPAAGVDIALDPADERADVAPIAPARPTVKTTATGAFTIPAVPPGQYRVTARGPAGVWARQDVWIDGADQSSLLLTLQAGISMTGRVVFESRTSREPESAELTGAKLTLSSANLVSRGLSAPVRADSTFALPSVPPGTYRLSLSMSSLRVTPESDTGLWTISSIVSGGVDISDGLLTIGAPPASLVVTLTDSPTQLVGVLLDDASRPIPHHPIVVFSANARDWTPGSRRTAIARPATDGTFHLIGLPPGRYYLCAVVDVNRRDLDDAVFLAQLVTGSIAVDLTAGGVTRQDLKLARPIK
jgi:protocatechuate 3,4-dioxygenase beta subunit